MAEQAFRGKTTRLDRETDTPGVYEEVTAIRGLTPPSGEGEQIETTTLRSSAREYIAGEPDFGSASFRRLHQNNAMFDKLNADFTLGTVRHWKLTYPSGKIETFEGFVKKFGHPEIAFDGVLETEVEVKVSGASVWS